MLKRVIQGTVIADSLQVTNGMTGNVTGGMTGNVTGDVTGDLTGNVTGGVKNTTALASADGAIALKAGVVLITKGSVAALTIAAPTATTDDGKILNIIATTAHAHTVTNASPGFNGAGASGDVATFGGAVGDNLVLVAYNAVWYVISKVNVTIA